MNIDASICEECQRVVIPPRGVCPYCGPGVSAMIPKSIGNEGILLSYTSLESPPVGFDPPVLLALVELEQGGSVLCLGDKNEMEQVEIGKRVKLSRNSEDRFIFHLC